ncbi:hypothetical protein ACFLZ8_02295 [Planctomycetota bacterium]
MNNLKSGNSNSASNQIGISHSPLDLGGSRPVEISKSDAPKQNAIQSPIQPQSQPVQMPAMGRITGIRTFFTKLHPGAINFLDEQIKEWLKNNPDIIVKRTNVVTGEIQAKKTDPNIIISIWY